MVRLSPPLKSCSERRDPCHSSLFVERGWDELFDWVADLNVTNKVLVAAGEGSGKSIHSSIFGYCRTRYDLMTLSRQPRLIWVIGADYEDAASDWEKSLWLEEEAENVTPGNVKISRGRRDYCTFRTNDGIEFRTVSAKDPTKIAREEVDGILGAECSRWQAEAFDRSFSRIARNANAWAFLTGSFETSEGPFHEYYEQGQGQNPQRLRSKSYPSWLNSHLYPGGRQDARIKEREASMSAMRFDERFAGRPAPPKSIVVPNFRRDTHVRKLEYVEGLPAFMFVDPGTLATVCLFVQIYNQTLWVLEEVYLTGKDQGTLIEYCKRTRGWRHITMAGHVIDKAGIQVHSGAPSPVSVWHTLTGITMNTSGKDMTVEDKAERVISMCQFNPETGKPLTFVDENCPGLISELGGGGRHPLADLGMGIWKRVRHADGSIGPIKSESDHAASAFAYGAAHHFGSDRPRDREISRGPVRYSLGGGQRQPGRIALSGAFRGY